MKHPLSPLGGGKPAENREIFITQIDFVDAARGWAVAWGGVWFTADGGQTWRQQLSGHYEAVYADETGVWVAGLGPSPTNFRETRKGILHSTDNGDTWKLEWKAQVPLTISVTIRLPNPFGLAGTKAEFSRDTILQLSTHAETRHALGKTQSRSRRQPVG